MRKQLQIDTGEGWQNLSSEFYAYGDEKAEAKAKVKLEHAMTTWPLRYDAYRHAQFRIIDTIK